MSPDMFHDAWKSCLAILALLVVMVFALGLLAGWIFL